LEPNRNITQELEETGNFKKKQNKKKVKVKTIPGISKYYHWEWPIDDPLSGYICARALPHVGSWNYYSPASVANLCNEEIVQPQPTFSTPTEPLTKWTIELPNLPGI
jgi:hypothetical protein